MKGQNSLAQKIQHSDLLSDMFQQACERVPNGIKNSIRNLSAAMHRYESLAKPSGRSVLWVDAFLLLAEQMLSHDDHRGAAESYLGFLSPESYLQNALLADAADESLLVTRYLDTDEFEVEEMAWTVGEMLNRVMLLFVQGQAGSVAGYTKFALSNLKVTRLLPFRKGGRCRIFGGEHQPDEDTKRACYQRTGARAAAPQPALSPGPTLSH